MYADFGEWIEDIFCSVDVLETLTIDPYCCSTHPLFSWNSVSFAMNSLYSGVRSKSGSSSGCRNLEPFGGIVYTEFVLEA